MPVNSFDNYYMSWKPSLENTTLPFYQALAKQLEDDIRNGILLPGTKLPPQRELADYLDINLSTVTRAFKICTQKGLIVSSTGNGTYISSDVVYDSNMLILNPLEEKVIEMGAILPSRFPNKHVTEAVESVLKEPNAEILMQYNSNLYNTRQLLMAARWISKTGITIDYHSILFASGGQNALTAILAGLFHAGDKIACDAFTYPGLKSTAKLLGIILVPLKEYSQEVLNNAYKYHNIKGIYLIADYHNPTTHVLDISTRQLIASFARKNNVIILEDAINALLTVNRYPPIYTFAPEHTIYFISLSKTLAPGLRLAYVLAPSQYQNDISMALYNMNISVSPLLGQAAATLIQSGSADTILSERKSFMIERNRIVNEYLSAYQVEGDDTCPFRWLILPEGYTSHVFEQLARASKVQVYAADRFLVGSTLPYEAIRFSVVSEENADNFIKGMQIIKKLLDDAHEEREKESLL